MVQGIMKSAAIAIPVTKMSRQGSCREVSGRSTEKASDTGEQTRSSVRKSRGRPRKAASKKYKSRASREILGLAKMRLPAPQQQRLQAATNASKPSKFDGCLEVVDVGVSSMLFGVEETIHLAPEADACSTENVPKEEASNTLSPVDDGQENAGFGSLTEIDVMAVKNEYLLDWFTRVSDVFATDAKRADKSFEMFEDSRL